jgi:hypothetical protein
MLNGNAFGGEAGPDGSFDGRLQNSRIAPATVVAASTAWNN